MSKVYLTAPWTVSGEKYEDLPATVPGCVHTDLLANGLLEDPFWRDNSAKCQWIENEDWVYRCRFDAKIGGRVELVFEGLDTYAEVILNGKSLGQTDDMFLPHCFDVTDILRERDNDLQVKFFSPIKAVEGKPRLPASFTQERIHSRRLQCTYGWDWVDRFVTCGIFRPVYLNYRNGIDLENVYIHTDHIDAYGAEVTAEFLFSDCEPGALTTVEILDPDGATVAKTQFYADRPLMVRRFDITEPKLWFPNGYGEQPLYRMAVTVGENRHEEAFGIRTLRILQLRDREGSAEWKKSVALQETEHGKWNSENTEFYGFSVIVNGIKVFCMGGNWVPCDPFPSAESDEKIERLVAQAKEMGANMLRVWGGGLFEKKAFYDACDRAGILVTQDFLMACGSYPEKEQWFIDALRRESEFATIYLRNHPCLAWWHGDNENAEKGSDVLPDYRGRDSALRGIADAIYANDYTRAFLPSSPYGGVTYGSINSGTAHNSNYIVLMYNYFHETDLHDYKEYIGQFSARFISEEPTFGAVPKRSMLKFMTEADLYDESEEMLRYHTKSNPALARHLYGDICDLTEKVLGAFRNGQDRHFKYQYIQYEWIRLCFERCRRDLGYCNGEVFWMFDDCWPAALGWSLVDYYGAPKAGYYSFLHGAKPLSASVLPQDGAYRLYISNITGGAKNFAVQVTVMRLTDGLPVETTYTFSGRVDAYSVSARPLALPIRNGQLVVCDISYAGGTDRCFWKNGKLEIVLAEGIVEVTNKTAHSVTLRAKSYVHAVSLDGDCRYADNWFSMLAGEKRTVDFTPNDPNGNVEPELTVYTLKTEDI